MEGIPVFTKSVAVATSTIVQGFLQSIDGLTLVVTIAIAVIGWIFALLLQRWNIRQEHRVEVRYDIYKQLVFLHKHTQEAIGQLSAHASSPFISMKSSMIPFDLKLTKEYKNIWIPHSEMECVFDGEQKWTKFVQSLMDNYFDYTKKHLNFMFVLEDWSAAVKSLLQTRRVLSEEINKVNNQILEDLKILQMYSSSHSHDWRVWSEKEIEEILERVSRSGYIVSTYLVDFMTLLHNQLLSGYFRYKRPIRKTLDANFKVLTKKGLMVRLEKNHEQLRKDLESKA